ncbi:MAG: translation initiation factor IF-3 [Shewanellaceae bacterium]|nr:translation initiation factor IF-3 [Shewanellaceae bacterium]
MKGNQKGSATKHANRINGQIRDLKEVRLTGIDGEQLGIVSLADAQSKADETGFDLVEISPNAEPPVCKIMDYGKYIFEKAKSQKEQRKKQKQVQIKEIKIRPGTDEADYQVKLRSLIRFLDGGDKAKVTLRFRGREMAHPDLGINLLKRIKDDLEERASVESFPTKLEGRLAIMVLAPKKSK